MGLRARLFSNVFNNSSFTGTITATGTTFNGSTITAATQINVGSTSTVLVESAGGFLGVRGLTANNSGAIRRFGNNGGYVDWASNTELLTLSTGGTTTDTSANLLPATSYIECVTARITTTIATATDWRLGDATTAGRFTAANSTLTAGTTTVGLVHCDVTGAGGPRQTAAAPVRVTTTGTPSAGAMRITAFYRQFVAPTS